MVMNVPLDTANINAISILTVDFKKQQHFSENWTQPHLQKMRNIPEVPVTQFYRGMINTSEPIHSFTIRMMTRTHPHMDNLKASWDIHRDY